MILFLLFGIASLVSSLSARPGALAYCDWAIKRYNLDDGREVLTGEQVRGTRGGGHDARPEELTTTQRGRQVSRNPRGGHHNIRFRCAR